jgi:hypothetical protein
LARFGIAGVVMGISSRVLGESGDYPRQVSQKLRRHLAPDHRIRAQTGGTGYQQGNHDCEYAVAQGLDTSGIGQLNRRT